VAITAVRVSVDTTATLLTVGRDRDGKPGRSVAVHNPGPETVYLGSVDVTTDDGYQLDPGADFSIDLEAATDLLYGVADVAQDVHVVQVGV
jgi:hypothetical protein